MQLSPHFTLHEMCRSQLASRMGLDNTADNAAIENMARLCVHVLEPLRAHFNRPIYPSSGYRSAALNSALGGAARSQHCRGQAVDFDIAAVPHHRVAAWIVANLTFDQLIVEYPQADNDEAGWLHISYVIQGDRKQTLTKTQNGYKRGFPVFW